MASASSLLPRAVAQVAAGGPQRAWPPGLVRWWWIGVAGIALIALITLAASWATGAGRRRNRGDTGAAH
ncbi:MAG TPA: hypothetical protein VHH90_08635 [Polyangia bacterium]|nr:hypothetical protein [Polyangia bacterium]